MTTKFSKQDSKRLDDMRAELQEIAAKIAEAMGALEDPIAAVNTLIEEYNEKLQEARGIIEDVASEVEGFIDEKSDNWRDGERGQAIQSWLDELQNVDLEDVETIEAPDMPNLDHDGTLENIPQEAML